MVWNLSTFFTIKKYGSAMFVKNVIIIKSIKIHKTGDIEVLTIDLWTILITSVYKSPNTLFKPFGMCNHDVQQKIRVVIGDFNCYSLSWSYKNMNDEWQKIEEWAKSNNLTLIHDPKLPVSYNSEK